MPEIDWDVLIKVLTGLVTVATGLAGLLKSDGGRREAARQEAELLGKLPEGSKAHTALLTLLEADVADLADRRNWRRDWPMAIVSLVCAPGLGYLSLWLAQRGAWWGWLFAGPAALMALVFLFGLFECIQLAPRDAKGVRKQ